MKTIVLRDLGSLLLTLAVGLISVGCGGAQDGLEWEDGRAVYSCPTHETITDAMAQDLAKRDLVGVTEALASVDDRRCWRSAIHVAALAPGADSLRIITSFIGKHGHRLILGKDEGILRRAFDSVARLVPRGANTDDQATATKYPAAKDALRYLSGGTLPGVWMKRGKAWRVDSVLKREVARRMAREAVAALASTGNYTAWSRLEELARDAVDRLAHRFQFQSAQGEKGAFADLINVYALPPGRIAFAIRGTMYLLGDGDKDNRTTKARTDKAALLEDNECSGKTAPPKDEGEKLGRDALRSRAQELLCQASTAFSGERSWAEKIQAGSRNEQTVSTADAEADKRLSGFLGQLQSQRKLRMKAEEQAAIERVTKVLFPEFPSGLQEVINGPFVDQAEHVLAAMKILREKHSTDLEMLDLDEYEKVVTLSHTMLNRALSADTWGVGFESLLRERGGLQRTLRVFIATALAVFPGNNEADASRRALVLGPLLEQNEQVDRYLRRGELVVDVDPKSGIEIAPPAEGLTLPKDDRAASLSH